MIRSLWTGTTGMHAQQLNIDVIANNLANVSTTGFKKSKADFQDLLFSLDDATQEIPDEDSRIIQGSLELSNVNMAAEMTKMIDSYRTFETYHKVLKSYSTIGEQQNELGTLG